MENRQDAKAVKYDRDSSCIVSVIVNEERWNEGRDNNCEKV